MGLGPVVLLWHLVSLRQVVELARSLPTVATPKFQKPLVVWMVGVQLIYTFESRLDLESDFDHF